MTATIQTLLLLIAVLVVVAVVARRFNTAPSIRLVIAGIGLALVPGLPRIPGTIIVVSTLTLATIPFAFLLKDHAARLPSKAGFSQRTSRCVRTRHKPQNRQGVKHDIVAPLRGHDLPRQEQIRRTVRFERKHECRRTAVAANLVQFF